MKCHQSNKTKHDDRPSQLIKVKDEYDYSDISYPTAFNDISKFEEANKLCIFC